MRIVYSLPTIRMASKSSTRIRYMFCLGLLVIVVLFVIIIWLGATRKQDDKIKEITVIVQEPLPGSIRPKAINVQDGIQTKWIPDAKRQADLDKAVSDLYGMIDVTLTETYQGEKGITLDTLWNVLQTTNIGTKINIRSIEEAVSVVNFVKHKHFNHPVLLSVPIFSLGQGFNITRFYEILANTVFTNAIAINFEVSPDCCDSSGIGYGLVEYIGHLLKKTNFSVSVEMHVDLIQSSWTNIKWLLDTNPNLQLILSAKSGYNASKYDLLLVRNDIDGDRIFYNIDGDLYTDFLDLASIAGSPLLYFGISPRDASDVIWSHNTDTWELLNAATQGDVMMIEGDIMLLGQDTPTQTNLPIMAHNVGDYNNLTFEQWIDEIIKVDKGMKLDFKTIDGVRPALEIVARKKSQIKGPVWANADILKGPNSADPRVPASDFLKAVETFPNVVLSLSWKTIQKGQKYNLNFTMDMVQEMYETVKDVKLPITFPVRAEQLVDSWRAFEWLLAQSRGYTLTVWTGHGDNVTKADMDFIRRKSEASRIYFDLPVDLRPTIDQSRLSIK